MASFDQKLRTLRLMEILLERTDDTHMLNASELCTILEQEYGISTDRRTIYTEMALLVETSTDTIGRIERKQKIASYEVLFRIARYFDKPAEDVFWYE